MFDSSGVVGFLTEWDDTEEQRANMIMADLGYPGIQKSGVRAVLRQKRGRGQELDDQQK
jgi:hypothetical protein